MCVISRQLAENLDPLCAGTSDSMRMSGGYAKSTRPGGRRLTQCLDTWMMTLMTVSRHVTDMWRRFLVVKNHCLYKTQHPSQSRYSQICPQHNSVGRHPCTLILKICRNPNGLPSKSMVSKITSTLKVIVGLVLYSKSTCFLTCTIFVF
ncbi:hypothetical protein Pfo_003612 [Paulownia fortunei]|nr:hypothetical protein Pfo_003612 [Paulownia fortunei]